MEDLIKSIVEILENNGVYISLEHYKEPLNMDSLTYVTCIVDLENRFKIEFDDEELIIEKLSLEDFERIILKKISNIT